MNGQLKIETITVIVVTDADGTEGVPAIAGPGGMMMPLISADEKRLSQFLPIAEDLAREGRHVKLIQFKNPETVKQWNSN